MLVVLIGWFESTAKQLMPFVTLHRDLGHRTDLLAGNGVDGLFRMDRLHEACDAKARDLVEAAGDDDLLIHAFSDTGFTVLCILMHSLHKTDEGQRLLKRIRGIIVDSAPGLYAADRAEFSRRFAYVMTQFLLRKLRWPAGRYQALLMRVCQRLLDLYQLGWASTVRRIQGAFDAVSTDYPACPHLFLYGDRDPITPPADVEAFASALQSRGLPRQLVRFDTAAHLGAYRAAPLQYSEAVHRFHRTLQQTADPVRQQVRSGGS